MRSKEANAGRDFNPLVDIHFENLNADTIGLRGIDTGSGVRVMRVPYWLGQRGMQSVYIDDDWTVDLGTLSINETTFTGGLVDGQSFAASTDYPLFAFFDPFDPNNDKFKGFGATTRPQTTASAVSSGTRGSEATFTVPSPEANRFNLGSRVICRQGTLIGDDYNQGTVTAIVSATSIKIQLDDSYGGIVETNTDLSGSGIEILQTNFFAPKMDTTTESLYPGGGVEYAYRFIGLVQSDDLSDIHNFAKPGKFLYTRPLSMKVATATTSGITTQCLSRWVPINTDRFLMQGNGNMSSGTSGNYIFGLKNSDVGQVTSELFKFNATGNIVLAVLTDECDINLSNNSFELDHVLSGNHVATTDIFLRGYTLYE
jgi:hypothetical protein